MNAPVAKELPPHGYVITKPVRGSDIPVDLTFVLTRDEIYVPVAVRKPEGDGPFPVITMGRGDGRAGMPHVEAQVERLAAMQDEMIRRGYVVVYVNYRNEIPHRYAQLQRAQNIPDSISGGENPTLKSAATIDSDDFHRDPQLSAHAAVCGQGGHRRRRREPRRRNDSEGRCRDGLSQRRVDRGRLARVPERGHRPGRAAQGQRNPVPGHRGRAEKRRQGAGDGTHPAHQTPILHIGREKDHLQGIFKLAHEWMREAGKDSTWVEFRPPAHGYPFIYRQADGSYRPEPVQQQAFDLFMEFFDRHLEESSMTAH